MTRAMRQRRSNYIALRLVALVMGLAGCATLPGAHTEVIQGKRVEFVRAGRGSPAVVFENGLGGRLDWWSKVLPEVAKETTAFAYNRPGYGRSSNPDTDRDGAHIVDELRAILRSQGLSPPYILVGHSLGGLYMQYFARRYPDEVAALVLVDSTHPRQLQGAGSRENWPVWFRMLYGATASPTTKRELNATNATGESVLALPEFTGQPVVVLTATEPSTASSEFIRDLIEKRNGIAGLFPGSKQVWVKGGHAVPLEHPQAVIDAIHDVRKPSPGIGTGPEAARGHQDDGR